MVTQRTHPTNHGLLSEARHVVLPAGIVSSAFPAVQATCALIGLFFDSWQTDLNRCILAKDSSGLYAADTVAISIPRQVGKTYDIGALVFADCIINPGTTTVWTAHRFKVARETFDALRAMAKSQLLAPYIDYDAITTAAGNECIPFRNGSRIVFAARERGAIRGFSKVRRIVLDEAQILSESALADMVPTMNQADNPQIILMGTPPKPNDPGEVFANIRREALSGDSEGVVYVEFAAEPGSDPDDRNAWRKANPSFPKRTPAKAILRMKKLLGNDDFMREGLGIWDSDALGWKVISEAAWKARLSRLVAPVAPVILSVETAFDRTSSTLVAVSSAGHDTAQVKVLRTAAGTAWVPAQVVQIGRDHREVESIVIDDKSPAGALADAVRTALEVAGVDMDVITTNSSDMAQGCAQLVDAIANGTIAHGGDPALTAAVRGAVTAPMSDAWKWSRQKGGPVVAPLVAMTLAHWQWRQLMDTPSPMSQIF